jgi:hypothetical protein
MVQPLALLRTLGIALIAATLAFAPARAEVRFVTTITTTTVSWVDDDAANASFDDESLLDDATLADEDGAVDTGLSATRRYARSASLATLGRAKARFGPFSVIDNQTIRMAGDVDGSTPRAFAAMMAAYPHLHRIEMVDCPGSLDEEANMMLARAIRRAGMETVVPQGGSVRSGAVELFLAGVKRSAAPDAEFGVHSWRDENGLEASDYPANDPVHAEYLNYYREMGLDAAKAAAFYTLTNSTSFDDVRYLTRDDMARFITLN